MAFGVHLMRCIPTVFWQKKRYNAPVSTRTETDGFTGFSGSDRHIRKGNGARIGRILVLLLNTPLFNTYEVN